MGRLGYRKWEPNEPPREHPILLKRMVEFHRNKLGYSTKEMAALFDLFVPEFEAMYGTGITGGDERRSSYLRVVK